MKVLGIIPARYNSSRLPGKPLLDIAGKTMIQRVFERAKSILHDVVVATDDERIFQHVQDFGGEAIMTETGHKTGTNRCLEAFNSLDTEADIILNIQGDEPLLHTDHIKKILSCFEDSTVNMASLALKASQNDELVHGDGVYVVLDNKNNALYFSRSIIPHVRDKESGNWGREHQFYRHVGMYAFKPASLAEFASLPISSLERAESLEQNRWLENGGKIRMGITELPVIAVDTPEDLKRVREILGGENRI